jgi:uncharacterized protein (TIGR02453 family)
MTFAGFGPKALPFFKALKFHQSREWFEANRETYESAVKGPMGDLAEDVAERLRQAKIPIKGDRKSSLFRIHRDVRLSVNKDPYKTNSGIVLSRSGNKNDPGLLYFHLSPAECFFAAGFYRPDPTQIARLRNAAVRAPKPFKLVAARLRKAGLALSGDDSLKRAPRLRDDPGSRDRCGNEAQEHDLPACGRRGGDRHPGAGRRLLRLRGRCATAAQMGLGRAG